MIPKSFMPWCNWAVTTAFVLFQFFIQASAGLIGHYWVDDFQLTATELGYLSGSFYLAYVLMQIPVGIAYDNFGVRTMLCLASLALCLGVTGLALSHNYWQALIARLLMGFGSSFGFVGMLYVASSWFSKKYFSILVGICETLGMAGVALMEIVMAWVVSNYGWRFLLLIAANIMTLINLFVFITIKDRPRSIKETSRSARSTFSLLKQVFNYPQVWLAGLYGFALFSIVSVVVTLWGIAYFMQYFSTITLQDTSSLMSMVFIGIAIGAPFNSWLVTKIEKREQIMIIFSCIVAILFSAVIYIPLLSLTTLCILLFFCGFFSASYIHVYTVVKESCPIEIQGTALATTNMILMSSAPILQPLIGKLLELNFTYSQSLSVIEGLLILSIGAACLLLHLKTLNYSYCEENS